jgi:hypothetical protein
MNSTCQGGWKLLFRVKGLGKVSKMNVKFRTHSPSTILSFIGSLFRHMINYEVYLIQALGYSREDCCFYSHEDLVGFQFL